MNMPGEENKKNKNHLFIISGPSGSGQDSIIEGLKKILPVERVITTTTRLMRPGEKPGRPYYFISSNEFLKNIKGKKFFEYAREYNNNFYGVTNEEINRVKQSKKIGIWKIEYQGVMAAKKLMPGIIAIFINAPLKTLIQRVKKRDRASSAYMAERLKYTREWLKHTDIYDYIVINKENKLDKTIEKVAKIIKENLHLF